MDEPAPVTPRVPGQAASSWDEVPYPEPPPGPRECVSLKQALLSRCEQRVHETLSHDETLVHVPITTTAGCEPPVIAATRMGCSVPILQVLLSHGASVNACSRCGAPALHILAMPHEEVETLKQPTQAEELQRMAVPALADRLHRLHDLPIDVGHVGSWPHLRMGSAASSSLPPVAHVSEHHACAIALCLLRHGANAAEVWNGLLPAEAARQSGHQCLANVIEHFMWQRAQRLLAKHRSAAGDHRKGFAALLGRHNTVLKLISQFLAPSCSQCSCIVAAHLSKAERIEGIEESECS